MGTRQGTIGRLSRLAVAATLMVLSACSYKETNLRRIDGAQFVPEYDERAMWDRATNLDEEIQRRKLTFDDAELQRYLDGVTARLLSESHASGAPVRVRVLRDPFLNAFALPNGTVYLHSGILARMENEAQLATVLGHELSHFLRRHSLKETRTAENSRTTARTIMIVLAVAVATAGGDASLARVFAEVADPAADTLLDARIQGYSRNLETEADGDGFDAMRRAGYDPREAPKVFLQLQEEQQESGVQEPYFFGSHPRLSERVNFHRARLKSWTAPAEPTGLRIGAQEMNDAISGLLLENAMLDLRMRRTARARQAVDRHLAHRPTSARGHFVLGELHRRSGDMQAALVAYSRAVELDASFADPHREIGMLERTLGRSAAARVAFDRYLSLAVDAPDHAIVRGYVADLAGEGIAP